MGTCSKETRLCIQNMIIILGSIVSTMGRNLCDHLTSTRIFTLIIKKIIMCNLKKREKHDYNLDLDWLTILYKSCVAHPRRSMLTEKNNHSRPILS
jgi:hypothetical protein